MAIEMIETQEQSFRAGACLKVFGVGGGGGNTVEYMIERGVQGVEFICANTDSQVLFRSGAQRTIQLGASGRGAGGHPDRGREFAEAAVGEIREALDGAHMVFITAGMGGGTGTGAAPVIARVAREMGILTVGVVTKPFEWEGGRCMAVAEAGALELEANVDSLIVVLNEKLLEELDDEVGEEEAFAYANDVLKNAVVGIAEIINTAGQINMDFEDVKSVMIEPGKAMMGTATASGPDRARIAAEQAVACPLLEGIDLSGAKGVLVLISSARGSRKLKESSIAMNTVRAYAAPDALVIYGSAYDDSLGDGMRITVIATGLSRKSARRGTTSMQLVARTGTDDVPVFAAGAGQNPQGALATPSMSNVSPAGNVSASVWGTGRERATGASSSVGPFSGSSMEDLEVPAYLRRQAD